MTRSTWATAMLSPHLPALLAPLLMLLATPAPAADLSALMRPMPRAEHRQARAWTLEQAAAPATAPAAPQRMPTTLANTDQAAMPLTAVAAVNPVLAANATSAAPALTPAAAARPAAPPADTRFDLVINNAPAAQVFLQLAQGTAWNMLVSPDVSGNLSIALRDTTVPEAMETLRELFGFDYRITGNRSTRQTHQTKQGQITHFNCTQLNCVKLQPCPPKTPPFLPTKP